MYAAVLVEAWLKSRPNGRGSALADIASSLVEVLQITGAAQRVRIETARDTSVQNGPRVDRQAANFRSEVAIDRVAHPDIGDLGLGVRNQRVVRAFLEVHVVEAEFAEAVSGAGEGDDSARRVAGAGLREQGFEKTEQQEVAEVVAAELELVAVLGEAEGSCHDS